MKKHSQFRSVGQRYVQLAILFVLGLSTLPVSVSVANETELTARGPKQARSLGHVLAPIVLDRSIDGDVTLHKETGEIWIAVKKLSLVPAGDEDGQNETRSRKLGSVVEKVSESKRLRIRISARDAGKKVIEHFIGSIADSSRVVLLGWLSTKPDQPYLIYETGAGIKSEIPAIPVASATSGEALLRDSSTLASLRNCDYLSERHWARISSIGDPMIRRIALFEIISSTYQHTPASRATITSRSAFLQRVLSAMGKDLDTSAWVRIAYFLLAMDGNPKANAPLYQDKRLWMSAVTSSDEAIASAALSRLNSEGLRDLYPQFSVGAIAAHLNGTAGATTGTLGVCESVARKLGKNGKPYPSGTISSLVSGLVKVTAPSKSSAFYRKGWKLCGLLCEHSPQLRKEMRDSSEPAASALRQRVLAAPGTGVEELVTKVRELVMRERR